MVEQKPLDIRTFVCTFILPVYLVFLSSCATIQNNLNAEDIAIDNQVKECIEIMPNAVLYKRGFAYLNTTLRPIKSTGYCGCKSALLSYKVTAKKKDAASVLHYGEFSSLNQGAFDFLVCSESLQDPDSFKIDVQCKNPE